MLAAASQLRSWRHSSKQAQLASSTAGDQFSFFGHPIFLHVLSLKGHFFEHLHVTGCTTGAQPGPIFLISLKQAWWCTPQAVLVEGEQQSSADSS